MGEVYHARDPRLKRDVAIKVLPAEWAQDSERRMRFQREAELLATLNHPNIGAIYGLEESDGATGLVLELVEGPTLADRLKRGPLPLREALVIARQIADALDAAHERGVVHRDLKPENIKVRPDGAVKVLDFGLAKADVAPHGESWSTRADVGSRAGVLLGTPRYMSPEQAHGHTVDKRTDIWAFGCVLFEMLSGRPAFGGSTVAAVLAAVLEREPDWKSLPRTTPERISRLLRRCLQKDPRRRARDIGDVRVELGETPSRDRWLSPAWAVGASLVIVALGTLWVLRPTGGGVDPSLVEVRRLTNYGGSQSDGAISPDGRTFAFVSDHGDAPDIWLGQVAGGEPVRLTNDPLREAELAFTPDGDGIYFTRTEGNVPAIWQIPALGGQARKVIDGAYAVAPALDGRRLGYFVPAAIGREGMTLVVSGVDGSDRRELAAGVPGFPPLRPAWSYDGRAISYVTGGLFAARNLFVVDVETGRQRQLTAYQRPPEGTGQHVWLPGDRYIAASYLPYSRALPILDIGVFDTRSRSVQRVTAAASESFTASSLSRDGARLIATSTNTTREVWKIPLASQDPVVNGEGGVRLLDASVDAMWTFVSRDGRTLLYAGTASGTRNLWTMPLDGGERPRQITSVTGDAVAHPSLSPDGTKVAFVSFEGGTSDIWTQDVDGSDRRRLTADEASDSWPVWSPDGTRIVFTSARGAVVETRVMSSDGTANEKLVDGFFRGDWILHPDGEGTLIATTLGRNSTGVRLIDGEDGRVVWEREIPGMNFSLPLFSSDGLRISAPYRGADGRAGILVFDTATGDEDLVAMLPFDVVFRASWVDGDSALVVNRQQVATHIVLFDRFWNP